jgi:uridine phosphorylase
METSSMKSEIDTVVTVGATSDTALVSTVQYQASELVENSAGLVYHLAIAAETLAKKIILVGDPARVDLVASFFDTILHSSHHREFTAKSGMYKGKHITVMSTGIGTDNIDITLNELDACVNIDLHKRVDVEDLTSLEIVRIGTCGILQKDVPLFSYIVSSYAYGFDNVAHFYDLPPAPASSSEQQVKVALDTHITGVFPMDFVKPYITTPDNDLVQKLSSDKTVAGLTVTSSGFYGPQGRALRLNTKTRNLNDKLMSFVFPVPVHVTVATEEVVLIEDERSEQQQEATEIRVMNYEMETSALFAPLRLHLSRSGKQSCWKIWH